MEESSNDLKYGRSDEWSEEKKDLHYKVYSKGRKSREKKYLEEKDKDLGIAKTCYLKKDDGSKVLTGPRESHKYIRYNEYHIVDDFLPKEKADKLLSYCLKAKDDFVFKTQSNRSSHLLFEKSFGIYRKFINDCVKDIHAKCNDLTNLFVPGYVEAQITRSGNKDFFGIHTDPGCNGSQNLFNRRVTFIYYIHNSTFEGGNLLLHLDSRNTVKVKPIHNRLVIMYPFILHEIERMYCGNNWEDGRFTLNGWFWDIKSKPSRDIYETT